MSGALGQDFTVLVRMPLAFCSPSTVSLHFWAREAKFFSKASAMRYFSTTSIKHVT